MNIRNLIMASVAVRGVYRRFAELSEEEKAQVVEKVKQKLKEKYPEAEGEAAPAEGESAPEETPAPAEGEAPAESPAEDTPGAEDSDLVDVGNLDFSDQPAEGDAEKDADDVAEDEAMAEGEEPAGENGEAGGDTEAFPEYAESENAEGDAGDTQLAIEPDNPGEAVEEDEPEGFGAEPEAEDSSLPTLEETPAETEEAVTPPAEDETEEEEEPAEEEAEENEETDESSAVPATPGTPMGDIADDIAEDVGEIQEEGKVDPARVLDLFENMMKMVTLLVRATPPEEGDGEVDEEKVARRVAEASVADRIVQRAK
jgi:hypothetical protein